jgi:sugar lactone lactonase YvrE
MASANASPSVTVVADHLANPRGLSFVGGSETLLVAQAGFGSGSRTAGVQVGTGKTGLVTAILDADGRHTRTATVASHLWSQTESSAQRGTETVGPAGINAANPHRVLLAMSENFVTGLGPQPQEGRLLAIDAGHTFSVADVATANLKWESIPANKALNPQFPDTNPYGVTVTRGHQTYVVDAGANTVDRIGPRGRVNVIAYLPNTPLSDAVPTCISQGPDGALYIGTLSIADGPGAAHVYRVDPRSHASVTTKATVWASGLSAINGCTFSRDGKYFYASEYIAMEKITGPVAGAPPAAVVKIPFDDPTSHTYLGLDALHFAGGVAVDDDGSVYVTSWSNQPAGPAMGQVLRLNR